MKQRIIKLLDFGSTENLSMIEVSIPKPESGKIVVKNNAIGLNFIDIYFRTGLYPWPNNDEIKIPGSEGVGYVYAVGENVKDFKEGDKVAYVSNVGACAEYAHINSSSAVKINFTVDDFDVAASTLKGLTTHYLLNLITEVDDTKTLLVHAAAGGVGQLMGQWGKDIGATMIGTAGGPEKVQTATNQGYDHVIDYKKDNFVDEVIKFTNKNKCDVVYDGVAKDVFPGSMDCLKPRGLWVLFGQSSGPITDFNFGMLSAKGSLFVTRPTLATFIADRIEYNKSADELYSRISNGKLNIGIYEKMPLENISEAQDLLESRKTQGSIVFSL